MNGDLSQAIDELDRSVKALSEDLREEKDSAKKERRILRWVIASLAFDIALSLAVAFGGYIVHSVQLDQEFNTENNRINQCVMINMFIRFEHSSTTSPSITEEERQQRIDLYKDIHKSHDSLKCPDQG